MKKFSRIAIDLAKNVFQVCIVNPDNKVTLNRKLKRKDLAAFIAQQAHSRVVMEACYSSHYWAREFQSLGHDVALIPAQFVKPFVRGNKNDSNDALAIAEAADRPHISHVPIKTLIQQDMQSLHRVRDRLVKERIQLSNQMRGLLSEYGVIMALGHKAFMGLMISLCDDQDQRLTPIMKHQVRHVKDEYEYLCARIKELNKQLTDIALHDPICQIMMSLPGVGFINATAMMGAIGRGQEFKNKRELSVWLGLTPRQSASGDQNHMLGITKRGSRYLRKQLVHGARAALSRCRNKEDDLSRWANKLIDRRGFNKASVAMASRLARLMWVLLQKNEMYQPHYSN